MKAMVYERYGGPEVLELRDVPKPAPGDNEVLIKVHATTVTAGDWRARSLQAPRGFGLLTRLVFGVSKPRRPILGMELSGVVEAVGKAVSKFAVGDAVVGDSGMNMGCHAEYKCLPENATLAPKPARLGHEEAAALSFGGATALAFLRKGGIKAGDKILINGASGAVGTAAVQLARHFGAEVTGVCSTGNVELVKSIGAHEVIDYVREDFTRSDERYDIIMDNAGTAPFARSRDALKPGGRLLQVLGTLADLLKAPWFSMTSGRKVIAGPVGGRPEDLRFLAGLAESGAFRPVIDRRYPFEQLPEAHRYVDTGRKRGNVVITLV